MKYALLGRKVINLFNNQNMLHLLAKRDNHKSFENHIKYVFLLNMTWEKPGMNIYA